MHHQQNFKHRDYSRSKRTKIPRPINQYILDITLSQWSTRYIRDRWEMRERSMIITWGRVRLLGLGNNKYLQSSQTAKAPVRLHNPSSGLNFLYRMFGEIFWCFLFTIWMYKYKIYNKQLSHNFIDLILIVP